MKIALLGDIAFYGKYSIRNPNVYEYFSDVANFLSIFDHVIGNLETPFCDSNYKPNGAKSAHIYAEEINVELLKYLNIDIVNLANNHIFDYGISGYENTKKILDANSIEYFGIENKQVFINEDGAKISLSGYCCYSTNGLGYYNPKTQRGVNVLNGYNVEKILLKNHKNGYFNIASIHAGQEHVNYPNYDHVEIARAFAKNVPYIFYGHHPHVIQGIEEYNGSIIAYSLGNFCFDDVYTPKSNCPVIKQSENNKNSIIFAVEIINQEITNYEIIPIYLDNEKMLISDKKVCNNIDIYSETIKMEKGQYNNLRKIKLKERTNNSTYRRDLKWYFNRLNFNTIKIIANASRNKKKYKENIINYIDQKRCK